MNQSSSSFTPLDGSPLMSDNCWNAITSSFLDRAKKEKNIRFLEWGAGNSTVNLLEKGFLLEGTLNLVSVEHDSKFFPLLAESALSVFLKHSSEARPVRLKWHELHGPFFSLKNISLVLKRHKKLLSSSIALQIILGNKRIQYSEGVIPNFRPSVSRVLWQTVKLFRLKYQYFSWLFKSCVRKYIEENPSQGHYSLVETKLGSLGDSIKSGLLMDFFSKYSKPGRLTIECGNVVLELWCIPPLGGFFWNKGLLFEGSIYQLPDFVGVPIEGTFDFVFVDGRARVSCIKRAYYDTLLKVGGTLFVHDAFRIEMAEGFRLFSKSFTFLNGSNKMINGKARCEEGSGPPFVRVGENLDEVRFHINQELFIYQNKHEHSKT